VSLRDDISDGHFWLAPSVRYICRKSSQQKFTKLRQERHGGRSQGPNMPLLRSFFILGTAGYNDAAPTALRKGGRETLKEKLKPYLQTGEWIE